VQFSFLSRNIKKTSHYKYVEDGYNTLLYNNLILNEESIVFDIGGFKGDFTNMILNMYKCNIFIFEPITEYYNFIRNRFINDNLVKCYNFGLGGSNCDAVIRKSGSSSSIFSDFGSSEINENIKIRSITEFIINNDFNKIDLIKINIEGSEFDLLESLLLNNKIINRIYILLIQFHDFIKDADNRRYIIQKKLSKTHKKEFDYPYNWEKWVIKI